MKKILFLALIIASAAMTLPAQQTQSPIGRWQVKFALMDTKEQNLVFTAQEHGVGSFQLLDTAVDNKPVAGAQAAAWSLTNDHLSFTGEVELQIGNCCREMGTLIFKSNYKSSDSLSGKIVFVTSVDEEESPYRYKSTIGTFTAKRLK